MYMGICYPVEFSNLVVTPTQQRKNVTNLKAVEYENQQDCGKLVEVSAR